MATCASPRAFGVSKGMAARSAPVNASTLPAEDALSAGPSRAAASWAIVGGCPSALDNAVRKTNAAMMLMANTLGKRLAGFRDDIDPLQTLRSSVDRFVCAAVTGTSSGAAEDQR